MLHTLIIKEIRENLYRYTFMIICLMTVLLVTAGMFTMYRDYAARMENYDLLRPGADEPAASVQPTPLSIAVKGLDDMIGRSYRVVFGGQIEVGGSQQSVNALFGFFTTPDMLYIVKVVMSLAALLMSFTLIAGERESGTLALMLSNSVSRPLVILSKWLGGFMIVAAPFVIVFTLSALVLSLSPRVQFMAGDWARLGLFMMASLVYMGFFYSLGLAASSLTRNVSTALVIALFLWVGIVFVAPNLGNTVAQRMVATPSAERLQQEREHVWIKEVFMMINGQASGSYDKTQAEALQTIKDENDRIMADYRSRFNQLVMTAKRITRLSPAAALTFFATDIAGTGIGELDRSKQAVLAYRDRVWNHPSDSGGNIQGEFPVFSYSRQTVGEVLGAEDGLLNLVVLMLYSIAAFAGAYVLFLRYDVRS